MRVLNIGSLNIDYVYSVDHIILPGETEDTGSRNVFLGGKGINQSCALAKAGVEVWHGGLIGEEGKMFLDACDEYGVNRTFIRTVDGPNGHTVIQIDKNAQNSILLFGGANQRFTKEFIDEILENFAAGDILLLQNEVNLLSYMVDSAYAKGMTIVLNPSPFNEKLKTVDMSKIGIFILNEVEGNQLTGEVDPEIILQKMHELYPNARIMLTLGKDGAVYSDGVQKIYQPIFKVRAVDTTAAGDTFTGYFLAGLVEGLPMEQILKMSAKASSICVTRAGAIPSVPYRSEVMESLENS